MVGKIAKPVEKNPSISIFTDINPTLYIFS